jgi:hypothetical protein
MTPLMSDDIWFIHTVLAQCFLPYRDPKKDTWHRKNGEFSIFLQAGVVEDPTQKEGYRGVGLPYGPKPRLFQSYICTQVIKQQSPVIPVERSMSAMMQELGLQVTGGNRGTIKPFKEQITRFGLQFYPCRPRPSGNEATYQTPPIKRFDVWFPTDPKQETLWPSRSC